MDLPGPRRTSRLPRPWAGAGHGSDRPRAADHHPTDRLEGVFGILKNASRQRLRRGQNRLPGLAMASLIAAIKVSVCNEEQLRAWHDRTGRGPADHPLLQPDPPYWGFSDLTKEEAKAIDAERLRHLYDRQQQPPEQAA